MVMPPLLLNYSLILVLLFLKSIAWINWKSIFNFCVIIEKAFSNTDKIGSYDIVNDVVGDVVKGTIYVKTI